jgi:hypothetical protein
MLDNDCGFAAPINCHKAVLVERWRDLNSWLFQNFTKELSPLFPLTSSLLADRRVADVK